MVQVITERPARPIPEGESVTGVDDGSDGTDWQPDTTTGIPPGDNPGDVLTWDGDSWEPAPGGGSDDDCTPFPHGSMGSTETLDPADGEVQTGTLTADLTVTLNAPTCDAFVMEFHATQDGTGGWDITWPGSVTVNGTPDTTLGTTTVWLLDTVDGGTTWTAFVAGGGTVVVALDDLSDVTITSPAAGEKLRYNGSVWVNANLHDEPMIATDGSIQTDGLLNPQMHEVAW